MLLAWVTVLACSFFTTPDGLDGQANYPSSLPGSAAEASLQQVWSLRFVLCCSHINPDGLDGQANQPKANDPSTYLGTAAEASLQQVWSLGVVLLRRPRSSRFGGLCFVLRSSLIILDGLGG